ncbi:MAG TPA: aminotransferase class V-fold PLP-dependent enzyme [Vicinamibacterales bacterium]|nr:aminotransferase class V-fold PLP-dependent enzyme [Vicinamibacterales bacterium]
MLTSAAPAVDYSLEGLRDREFARLGHHTYLDYAGSALYAESQVQDHHDFLTRTLLGNPHSSHPPSLASTRIIDDARRRVLTFLDADDATHVVSFTANATAAIKLVAESYPFGSDSVCVLSADNHNSVNGIRSYARRAGAEVRYLPLDADLRLAEPGVALAEAAQAGGGLLAFPAQSNFSGVRHPLHLVEHAHALGLDVLLDAAAFAPTAALSLRRCPADFTVLSFYKLFGYPTGVGALVARRDALDRLIRPWFSGGTVLFASVQLERHRLRADHEAFEDGTPNFIGIAALASGFDLLEGIGMSRLSTHVLGLTARLLHGLQSLRHANGCPVVQIYGPSDMTDRGGVVTFNVLDRSGHAVPYQVVEQRMAQAGVSVRGGCFCNPGAAEAAFGFDPRGSARCLDHLDGEFTVERFASCLGDGTAVGAIRASLGLATNADDVSRAIAIVAAC